MLWLFVLVVLSPFILTRLYFLFARLRLYVAGAAAAVKCSYCEADRDEEDVYGGAAEGCPAYDQLPLPRTGGTVHVPRDRSGAGVAILCVPGKGRVFNLFPLQKLLRDEGVEADVIGVDYSAYGTGFERNVRDRWLPRLLYEMRLEEMSGAMVEALEVTSGIFQKVLVVANSTAGAAVLDLLGSKAAEQLPGNVCGVWVTNPAVVFKDGHFLNSIVDSSLPTWCFAFLDRVLGLGPAQVMADGAQDWFYFAGDRKEIKHCFSIPGRAGGVMVGVPRYQQALNPTRFMHVAEVVKIVRHWAQGKARSHATSPPVHFSLNYRDDEWHCGAERAKDLLVAWGASEVGNIDTHEEWLFETMEQWQSVRSILKKLMADVLQVDWK